MGAPVQGRETLVARRADGLLPLKGAQARASAPDAHVWLSASAGTGKTHVLTARVFRLLLNNVEPEQILCLTFTKAGASEMAERIHSRLAAWVQMDGPALAEDLRALGEDITPAMRDRARLLFARVLEATGGGLRIQTIHSFCQQLLAAFPLEAGLVPGFRALEDREQQELARLALEELVVDAESQGDAALIDALHALALRLGEAGAEAYLKRCARAHMVFAEVPEDLRGWLFAALELPDSDIEAEIAARCGDEVFDVAALRRLARANAEWNTNTGLAHADCIAAWLAAAPPTRAATLIDPASCFLTAKGEPRSVTSGQEKADPDYADLAAGIAEDISELLALRTRAAYAEVAAKGLHAGRAYARAYEAAKRRKGAVDFDDLIAHAASLFSTDGIADWIRYKLDARIDHILVDEAQDTNSNQWTIIGALVEEFFVGEGARGPTMRTLFTVGDFKQAIFGFQGTSPQAFGQAKDDFKARALAFAHEFHDLSLDESFRSTPAVLEVVDACIAHLGAEALGLPPLAVHHESRNRYPGVVTVLKPLSAGVAGMEDAAQEAEGEEDWLSDQDRALAERIARQIRAWLDEPMMLESKGRPIAPGDIMILLRKRGDLARLIVARLYEAGVPVAGVDRLRLQAPLGVQDLVAALRFAAQPEDDLSLACLLVSPLVGWSQDDLWQRAVPRKSNLWRHLRESSLTPAADLSALYDILARADFITPYRLLEHILSGPMQGRRKLLGRLGAQALDSIEELLNAALRYEQDEQPSLQRFLDWFDREQGDIKRESAAGGDAVRILTVHGAKGLQAPVVILADACVDPDAGNRQEPLDIPMGEEGGALPFLPPRKAERWGVIDAASQLVAASAREEHWRLLYVAMTRAEEQLYVTGALGPRAKGVVAEVSWYAAIERAMLALGAEWRDDADWGAALQWRGAEALAPRRANAKGDTAKMLPLPLPEWARIEAPKEQRPSRPLTPTAPGEDMQPYPPPSAAMHAAAERGRLLHSLFERLPDVAPEARETAAHAWLERQGGVADAITRGELVRTVLGIIDDPALADLFGPDALAEAPVAAVVGEDVVNGVIDRLVIGGEVVRLVDFKTGRVPQEDADIPASHLRQMAAYAAALCVIFPTHKIDASLLYTSGPRLFALQHAILAPHKPGYTFEH